VIFVSSDECRWRRDIYVGIAFPTFVSRIYSFLVIRSVYPCPYNLNSPYLVHTVLIKCMCQGELLWPDIDLIFMVYWLC